MNNLKRELKKLLTGYITVWIDVDGSVHVRIDDRYFTTDVLIDRKTRNFYDNDSYLMATYVLAKYEKSLLKKFIKISKDEDLCCKNLEPMI